MLNIITIISLLILMILFCIITIFTIIGGNMNKSEEERKLEDEEQMKYLKKYRK